MYYWITKLRYSQYPNLVQAINTRYQNYNSSLETILDLENKKEIFVFRPSRSIHIKRIEKDPEKLQEMYDLGIEDCQNAIPALKKYLNQ